MARARLGRRLRADSFRAPLEHHGPPAGAQRKEVMNDTATALRITPANVRLGGAAMTTTSSAAPAIDIRDLDFFYGKGHALKNVSMAVPANSVTAIIGPSGCGKSTLLRTINRIYEMYPDQYATGEIVIDGRNILDRRYPLSDLRRLVGMVFQKPTPFPSSIKANVAFALSYYERLSKSELNDRVEDALRQAALWEEVKDKLHHSALSLSGGQQQRLCIARTIVIVTHNMQQAARVSQRT